MFKKEKNNEYLSIKESREIIKYNVKQMKYYEALKRVKRTEAEYTTVMNDENNLIEIDDLHTSFFTDRGTVKSVDGVSFSIPKNKIIGVVGESGCGKSVTSLSVMQLVAAPQGQITGGAIRFNSDKLGYDSNGKKLAYDITKMPTEAMHKIRGQDITMIFQEPMTSLNPVFTIGYQLDELSFLHKPELTKEQVKEYSIEMKKVGISMPERFYEAYPHELSGGMRQRVMIAMALAGNPKLIIADEPTTALDVTIQAQIIELMQEMQEKNGNAIIMITHDLGVVADMADKIMVMYAGRPVEFGTAEEIFYESRHPYTWGLIRSIPEQAIEEKKPLTPIHGNPPSLMNLPEGCVFSPRCPYATDKCRKQRPERVVTESGHYSACHYSGDPEFLKNAPETSRTRKDSKKGGEA